VANDVSQGTRRATSGRTLRRAAIDWLASAEVGTILNRSRDRYKPSAIKSYREALEKRVLQEFGACKLADISRLDVQDFVDRLHGEGLSASTVRNTLVPLQAIFRRALARGEVVVNPTTRIELPAVRGAPDRIATRDEAFALLDALVDDDRAVWATAFFAGLRRGELMGLRWEDADLSAGVVNVARSYDIKARVMVAPKSRSGIRRVPMTTVLREHLIAHRLRSGRHRGLVFGREEHAPLSYEGLLDRSRKAWDAACLQRIGLHEARHTFASLMIAAGVNVKALSTYMGHASITITLDRYGHLMPGNEAEAAGLLDAYLVRAT